MRTTTRRAAVLVAVGALGLGGVAVAAPALAGMGPFAGSPVVAATPGPEWAPEWAPAWAPGMAWATRG
jgi:hypothetical protein